MRKKSSLSDITGALLAGVGTTFLLLMVFVFTADLVFNAIAGFLKWSYRDYASLRYGFLWDTIAIGCIFIASTVGGWICSRCSRGYTYINIWILSAITFIGLLIFVIQSGRLIIAKDLLILSIIILAAIGGYFSGAAMCNRYKKRLAKQVDTLSFPADTP